ncbi:hypothetical protein ACA910_022296 [Epithemia clementina (nom. ined.)]
MAWCSGQKYTTEAISGDEENAEFFRVLTTQLLGDEPLSSPSQSCPATSSRSSTSQSKASLEFMFLDLNKSSMQLLLQALHFHKSVHNIKRLVFHGCRIRDQASLELLAQLFHLYTHWTYVEISCLCQGLGNEQARILIMEIMKCKNLEHLNISSMGISDGLILWRDVLSSSNSASPSSVVVRSSRINFDHTREFLSLLPMSAEKHHPLKHLDLSACRMNDHDMEMIAAGLRKMNVNLESLTLKGNLLSARSVPIIEGLLNDHKSLKSLDLSMNTRLFMEDDQESALSIESLIRAAIPEDNSRSMKRLVFSKTSVGDSAAIMMIKAVEYNITLQELDLNFCLLGERVMEQLVESLPRMRSLRQLLLHGLHFNQRNAATNPHDQRQVLWKALQENTSLILLQGLNMFLGAGRPELASVILEHLSERNQAMHKVRSLMGREGSSNGEKVDSRKLMPSLWPRCLEKLGKGSWTASAVFIFLQSNVTDLSKYS